MVVCSMTESTAAVSAENQRMSPSRLLFLIEPEWYVSKQSKNMSLAVEWNSITALNAWQSETVCRCHDYGHYFLFVGCRNDDGVSSLYETRKSRRVGARRSGRPLIIVGNQRTASISKNERYKYYLFLLGISSLLAHIGKGNGVEPVLWSCFGLCHPINAFRWTPNRISDSAKSQCGPHLPHSINMIL